MRIRFVSVTLMLLVRVSVVRAFARHFFMQRVVFVHKVSEFIFDICASILYSFFDNGLIRNPTSRCINCFVYSYTCQSRVFLCPVNNFVFDMRVYFSVCKYFLSLIFYPLLTCFLFFRIVIIIRIRVRTSVFNIAP